MEQYLARDPQNMKLYSDIIIEQEKRVFTERVRDPETTVGTCHYLSHHALFKPPQYASCKTAAADNP